MRRVAVLGCGLIGGSLLKALDPLDGYVLRAIDRDAALAEAVHEACPSATFHEMPTCLTMLPGDSKAADTAGTPDADDAALPMPDAATLDACRRELETAHPAFCAMLRETDILILCTPVDLIPYQAAVLATVTPALITDVGSTKAPLCRALHDLRFIGGHPMAGSERRGFACGRRDMFQNAPYCICVEDPSHYPGDPDEDLAWLEALARDLGAVPIRLTPDAHDRRVAYVSHLPHVAASALVCTVASLGRETLALSAGGFRDITRIASSDPDLWAEISQSSAPFLVPALEAYEASVRRFREALAEGRAESVRGLFARGREARDRLPADGTGALLTESAITVYVDDSPGTLADVTGILADAEISIRNLSLQNARQYEGGQLRIFVTDPGEQARSLDVLREAGYDCE